jgi:xanthine dehydrogenase/oxidase
MPVLAADGCHVTTIEGVGTLNENKLHPIQHAMVDMHGSQCGFCTPGIIVSMYTLLSSNDSVAHLEEHLDGNLCRCTGYRPIWDAGRSLCHDGEDVVSGPCGTPCRECPERETCSQDCNVEDIIVASSSKDKMKMYKDTFLADRSWLDQPSKMFPVELRDDNFELMKPLMIVDKSAYQASGTWFKPTSLLEMLSLLREFGGSATGSCKIVVGNTEVGIEQKFKHAVYPRLINPSESIIELFSLQVDETMLVIGSCSPLSSIQQYCERIAEEQPRLKRTLMPIHDMLRWFASGQIRNVACLGGNLVTASPISDMNPVLAAMNAVLVLSSMRDDGCIARRTVPVKDFFLRYRTVDLKSNELVERIEVPVLQPFFEYFYPFKQARRREDDISIVTSGMRIRLDLKDNHYVIEDVAISFGGMAPKSVMASKTMEALVGSKFCASTFEAASEVLLKEMNLPAEVPGGQAAYRTTLATSFLYKFYLLTVRNLTADIKYLKANPAVLPSLMSSIPVATEDIDPLDASGTTNWLSEPKPHFSGVQTFPAPKVVSGLEDKLYPLKESSKVKAEASVVGKPSTHQSGPLHCTGEAEYTDDIPLPPNILHAALITSTQCNVILEAIDKSDAVAIHGVQGVFTYEDLIELGGNNELGPIVHDETVFVPFGENVPSVNAVLGIVLAETLEAAELAAREVKVKYSSPKGEKIIVTIDDAIQANSFYDFSRHSMTKGDKKLLDGLAGLPDSSGLPSVGDVVKISGAFRSGPQEHFYLETHTSLVIPSEGNTNLTVYCSTQAVDKTQMCCASATGLQAHKIVVKVKRMGGGFGGKETRSVFATTAAAVAARCVNRPVRLTLPRNLDMKTTGQRHAFQSAYNASAVVTENGVKLLAMDMTLYANGGHGFDLSGPVVDRALFHCDGVYNCPNFRCEGVVCKTVQAPHTAFRGFGGPQGMVVAEHILDHFAIACGVSGDELRRLNMYQTGDVLPFGTRLGEHHGGAWHVPQMWDRLYKDAAVSDRRAQICEFNSKNKWVKRGLAVLPTKFGIAFTARYMNQGGALVHLYTDGSVLVSHGGTEMGQGLHTKICQVAAQALGIPITQVYINDSSSDKVANAMPTAASMSTDQYGMATLDACRQLLKRLEPVRMKMGPDATLKDIAKQAHFDRIDLTAHGFFALTDERCGFDWNKERPTDWPKDKPDNVWKGTPFNYFTQGVCVAECEIDILSGNHRTLRADLIVDVGSSINPTLDIGQIEGAFVQGMGWSTIEDFVHADDDHPWVHPRGDVFTTGPGTYKIPAFNDTPEVFNVSLLENVDNPFAVHSSKAIGEPPFFLGASVFYAIKDALRSARKQNLGKDEYFEMRLPATSERIRMYAADAIAAKATEQLLNSSRAIETFQPQGSF